MKVTLSGPFVAASSIQLKDGHSTTSSALAVVLTVGKPAKGISPGLSVDLGASAVVVLALAVGVAAFPAAVLLLATFASFVPQARDASSRQETKSRGDLSFIRFLFN